MKTLLSPALTMVVAAGLGFAADPEEADVVFRSDVSLVRVDVQVLDGGGGTITGLTAKDFELRDNGRRVEIKNFVREEMPIDVLFLLDVSGSMQPHIQSVARASRQALGVMGPDDRVGVMVFDRATRLRSPFRPSRDAYRDLERVIDQESFNGGTDVTGALKDAISYVARQGRREGRRAIVIVTDDMTEFNSDVPGIVRLLEKNDIVLSALIAPDAMGNRVGFPGGGRGRRPAGTWPGGGGINIPGFPGGIPTGRGGRRVPGGVIIGGNGMPVAAGSPEIAVQSGGDSYPVDDAGSLETTLERLRQRYALFFNAPPGSREGEERMIDVTLVGNGARRHPNAELRFRRSYIATDVVNDGAASSEPVTVTSTEEPRSSDDGEPAPRLRRRPNVSEPSSGPNPNVGGGWQRAETKDTEEDAPKTNRPAVAAKPEAPAEPEPKPTGGWRRATPADTNFAKVQTRK